MSRAITPDDRLRRARLPLARPLRIPKSDDRTGNDKKAPQKGMPTKTDPGKKPGP